ncbi:hypothetical protein LJR098_002092 [Rhizobium sp. LjRoot98]|uniref:hypothetical protein n=1 Tax=unclassified Rhizobium TaxID=2613769 RepID=UPI000714A00B|nr:hypothetical protein [Rhizobium sp. Root1204]KQV35282.1 hypothetical protein ASC96_29445 [Rhizobium sp. Root1204]
MINQPKFPASNEDRHLLCPEEVDGPLQDILDQANTHGWATLEAISAMEEVLKNLRIAYAEDPDPAEGPPNDSGDVNDFGEFPAAEGLLKATIEGKDKP